MRPLKVFTAVAAAIGLAIAQGIYTTRGSPIPVVQPDSVILLYHQDSTTTLFGYSERRNGQWRVCIFLPGGFITECVP